MRGSIYLGISSILTRPINMVGTIVLARLLDPYDFGVVALALLLATSSYLFVDLGMGPALIQSSLERRRVVFPTFVITMLCGSLITLLIITFALPLANFLGESRAAPAIRWLGWLVFLEAAITIPESLLRKDLHFGQVSLLKFTQEILNLVVSVVLAYLGYGFWSLVFGRLVSTFVQTAMAWVLCPGWEWLKPTRFEWGAIYGLLRYGIQATLSGVFSFVHENWDDWLVGRVFGAATLGFYTKAYTLTNNALSGLSRNLVNGVFFPSYAQIQEDKARLTRIYLKSLDFVLLMMIPIAAGFLIIAPQFISVLMGSKWLPAITVFQIYAALVFTRPISSNTAPLFMAMGRPDYNTRAALVLLSAMVPLVLLLLPYNIEGVALGVVIAHAIAATYNVYQANQLLPGTARKTAQALVAPLVASALMMTGVQLAKPLFLRLFGITEHNFVTLILLVIVGAAIYLGVAWFLQRALLTELVGLSRSAFGGGRRRRRQIPELAPE